MFTPIIHVLNYISISQLLLFALFFYIDNNGDKRSNRLLATLFICYAIWLSTYYINWYNYDYLLEHFPHVIGVFYIFNHTIGPLLYLYTCSLLFKDFRIRKIHLLYFVPFFYQIIIIFFRLVILPTDEKRSLLTEGHIYGLWEYIVLFSLLHLLNITFGILSFYEIRRYKRRSLDYISSSEKVDLRWLIIILSGVTSVFVFDTINHFYEIIRHDYLHFRDIVFFIMYLNFNTLIFFGLRKSKLFYKIESRIKYENSNLSDSDKKEMIVKLEHSMQSNRLYLVPSLTLQDVSEKTSIAPRSISQIINEIKGQNFYDFINSYRVEEAKRLLINSKYESYSMLGILYEAGFNSKTAFNTAFKKNTGLTPKEFRNQNM